VPACERSNHSADNFCPSSFSNTALPTGSARRGGSLFSFFCASFRSSPGTPRSFVELNQRLKTAALHPRYATHRPAGPSRHPKTAHACASDSALADFRRRRISPGRRRRGAPSLQRAAPASARGLTVLPALPSYAASQCRPVNARNTTPPASSSTSTSTRR
jgi:hypothetical protein